MRFKLCSDFDKNSFEKVKIEQQCTFTNLRIRFLAGHENLWRRSENPWNSGILWIIIIIIQTSTISFLWTPSISIFHYFSLQTLHKHASHMFYTFYFLPCPNICEQCLQKKNVSLKAFLQKKIKTKERNSKITSMKERNTVRKQEREQERKKITTRKAKRAR